MRSGLSIFRPGSLPTRSIHSSSDSQFCVEKRGFPRIREARFGLVRVEMYNPFPAWGVSHLSDSILISLVLHKAPPPPCDRRRLARRCRRRAAHVRDPASGGGLLPIRIEPGIDQGDGGVDRGVAQALLLSDELHQLVGAFDIWHAVLQGTGGRGGGGTTFVRGRVVLARH